MVGSNPAGTIVLKNGFGELEFDSKDGQQLPAGVDPMKNITMVTVLDSRGSMVLSANL
jgi:hypothetical protein